MFENKNYEGIYYSRFIASWINVGGRRINYKFKEWLGTLRINGNPIPEGVIQEIYNFGTNGKFELEVSAEHYLKEKGS